MKHTQFEITGVLEHVKLNYLLGGYVVGTIVQDNKDRFKKGDEIFTSHVSELIIFDEHVLAVTKNSVYMLLNVVLHEMLEYAESTEFDIKITDMHDAANDDPIVQETSTMFLRNITVIDHAYFEDGMVNGMSYNLSVELTGNIDPQEQVVIDFSTCKKQIKQLIDDSEFAIDHRLVVPTSMNVRKTDNGIYIKNSMFIIEALLNITTDSIYQKIEATNTYKGSLANYIKSVIEEQVTGVTECKVFLSEDFDLPDEVATHVPFHYVHGLRNSTSHGCQNIVHGHRSYIATDSLKSGNVLKEIAEMMEGVLIDEANLEIDDGDNVLIKYQSKRGKFAMSYPSIYTYVMPTETTIENITSHIAEQWGDALRESGATRLWVSEGLSKGAVIDL